LIYFPKGIRSHADLVSCGATGLGIDWGTDLARAASEVPQDIALQGNLDPAILLGTPEKIISETRGMLERVSADRAYIANLGHGIDKDTPVENARAFVTAVKES
jgi:uroporphyrinogen decarboxylase